jgi:hypothetical protein
MSVKYSPNDHTIYKHFPILGPQKFTQIGIFGLKRNHLATLVLGIGVLVIRRENADSDASLEFVVPSIATCLSKINCGERYH